MGEGGVERRRGRRVRFEAPLLIRRVGDGTTGPFQENVSKNASLAGLYFETEDAEAFAVDETVVTSLSVPEAERRDFPFTRLAGLSRVVRVEELPPRETGKKRFGIALKFGDDVTTLTATPARG